MSQQSRANALDHVVVVLFENRSFDNVLGRLYEPGDGKTFEGVIGKKLSNPIPEWAEHGADRKEVPYGVATDMDAPNPDSGEEWYHTNTQLFNTIDEHNRFKIGEGCDGAVERASGRCDADDGRVCHRLHQHLHRRSGPSADLPGVRPDHDRVHARAGTGAERHRARVRRLRPLVLRGSVADVHEQVVLDRGDLVGDRREQSDVQVEDAERRRDDLRAARAARQDMEGVRGSADAASRSTASSTRPGCRTGLRPTSCRSPSSSEMWPPERCPTSR